MGLLFCATVLLLFANSAFGVRSVRKSELGTETDITTPMIRATETPSENPCISKNNCKDCIRAHPDCAWCASQDLKYTSTGKKRCNYKKQIINECGASDTVYVYGYWKSNPYDEYHFYFRPGGGGGNKFGWFIESSTSTNLSVMAFRDNATENVQITYRIKCSRDKPVEENKNLCLGVNSGEHVEVSIDIELRSCPENRTKWNETIQIYQRRGHETYVMYNLHVHMLCECDCEKPGNEERNSPKCLGKGTYHCGVCSCPDNTHGNECQTEGKATRDIDDDRAYIARA